MAVKEQRLKKNNDFNAVFKAGKGMKEGFLFLKVAANNLGRFRFGFIVSRKISKRAVVRNKIRRRLKALAAKKNKESGPKGKDIVLVALPGIEKNSFSEISRAFNKLWEKVNLPK